MAHPGASVGFLADQGSGWFRRVVGIVIASEGANLIVGVPWGLEPLTAEAVVDCEVRSIAGK